RAMARRDARRWSCELPGADPEPIAREALDDRVVERAHAVVVEAARLRAEDRHLLGRGCEELAVPLVLLAHIAQRVLGALPIELVDGDEVREIEHVDLLELARRAELR